MNYDYTTIKRTKIEEAVEMNTERMRRMSSVLSVLTLIGAALMVAAAVVLLAFGAAAALSESIMNMILDLPAMTSDPNVVYAVVVIVSMYAVTVAVMLVYAHRLFSNVSRSHTPFETENVKNLKMISYILLFIAIPLTIAASVLSELLAPGIAAADPGTFTLIVAAVMFYFMAIVFEHGAELQKESDSTL